MLQQTKKTTATNSGTTTAFVQKKLSSSNFSIEVNLCQGQKPLIVFSTQGSSVYLEAPQPKNYLLATSFFNNSAITLLHDFSSLNTELSYSDIAFLLNKLSKANLFTNSSSQPVLALDKQQFFWVEGSLVTEKTLEAAKRILQTLLNSTPRDQTITLSL